MLDRMQIWRSEKQVGSDVAFVCVNCGNLTMRLDFLENIEREILNFMLNR